MLKRILHYMIPFHAIGNAVVSYGISINDGTGAMFSYGAQIIFAILVSYGKGLL